MVTMIFEDNQRKIMQEAIALFDQIRDHSERDYDFLVESQSRERWHYHNVLKELDLIIPSLPSRDSTIPFKRRLYRILLKILHFR